MITTILLSIIGLFIIGFFIYGLLSFFQSIKLKKLRRNYDAKENKSRREGPSREELKEFGKSNLTATDTRTTSSVPVAREGVVPGDDKPREQTTFQDEIVAELRKFEGTTTDAEPRVEQPNRSSEKDWPSFE